VTWSTVFLYGLASGVLAVIGRIRFGPEYLLESRYTTFSVAAPIGAVALTAAALVHASRESGPVGRVAIVCAGAGLELAMAIQVMLGVPQAIVRFRDTYRYRLHSKAALTYLDLATPRDVLLVNEYSETLVRRKARELLDMGLLRDIRHRTSYHPNGGRERATGCVESVATLPDGTARMSGWSYLSGERRPVDAILITNAGDTDRGPIAFAIPRLDRPDVVLTAGTDDALQTGWEVLVPPTSSAVTAWSYNAERNEAYEIARVCPTRSGPE
jgi:hypothetical protein